MYTNRVILKFNRCANPYVQHYAVINILSTTRNINFLQKCKDCLNSLMKTPNAKEKTCNISESCCSSRAPVEEAIYDSPPAIAASTRTQYGANVVIIGAGMAGLSAANHLQENGIENFTVLESLDRPGGRIHSCWFGDSIIELGAKIDKVPPVNPIMKDVFQDGFAKPAYNGADQSRGLLVRSDGTLIPYPISFQVYQTFKQIWAEANQLEEEESGQSRISKISFMGSRIEQEIRKYPSDYQTDAERLFHGLTSLSTVKSTHDKSLIQNSSFGDYIQLPGSKIRVPLGHSAEVISLYKKLPFKKVKFCKVVNKIKWGGVSGIFPRAIIICDDGEEYPTDYVIITLPLGVLKVMSDGLFCPGLPVAKIDAISKIPIGHVNKIFLEFTQPFWQWKSDFTKMTFDASSVSCKEGWLKGLCCVEPIQGSSHVMCITVAGPQSQCLEGLSDNQIICDICSLLKELFCKTSIPVPVRLKRTGWSLDPNFYGAHSYMGSGISPNSFYCLASPLPEQTELCDPVLFFAGEATCPLAYGTITGAKSSGIREAERLLQLVRLQEEKFEEKWEEKSEEKCEEKSEEKCEEKSEEKKIMECEV